MQMNPNPAMKFFFVKWLHIGTIWPIWLFNTIDIESSRPVSLREKHTRISRPLTDLTLRYDPYQAVSTRLTARKRYPYFPTLDWFPSSIRPLLSHLKPSLWFNKLPISLNSMNQMNPQSHQDMGVTRASIRSIDSSKIPVISVHYVWLLYEKSDNVDDIWSICHTRLSSTKKGSRRQLEIYTFMNIFYILFGPRPWKIYSYCYHCQITSSFSILSRLNSLNPNPLKYLASTLNVTAATWPSVRLPTWSGFKIRWPRSIKSDDFWILLYSHMTPFDDHFTRSVFCR